MRKNLDIKFALTSVTLFMGFIVYNIIEHGIPNI
jgi:hypothetical protein